MQRYFVRLLAMSWMILMISACGGEDQSSTDQSTDKNKATNNAPAENPDPAPEQPTPETDTIMPAADTGMEASASSGEIPDASKHSRIAYVNSADILSTMPSMQQAEQELQRFAQGLDQELRRQQQQLQQKYQQYQKDTDVSEAILKTRTQELQQMQQRIMELQRSSEEELAKRRQKLIKPIEQKVDKAIQTVAKDYGYTHVMDVAAGGLVYAEESTNITNLVKRELGVQ